MVLKWSNGSRRGTVPRFAGCPYRGNQPTDMKLISMCFSTKLAVDTTLLPIARCPHEKDQSSIQ
jgi:hypothetical protein